MKSLHIAFYAPALPGSGIANGIVTYTGHMRDALEAAGHRVSVIGGGKVQRPDGSIVPVEPARNIRTRIHDLASRFRRDRFDPINATEWVRRQVAAVHADDPIDVLEMEESFGWASGLRFAFPIVVRLHGPHFLGKDEAELPAAEQRSQRRIVAEGKGIRAADAITSPSARLLKKTAAFYALDGCNARAIPNPMPLAPEEDRWNELEADSDQVLCVGRFDQRKGADIAIKAFLVAVRARPELRMVLVGPDKGLPGADGTTVHFDDYILATAGAEGRERITFLGECAPIKISSLRRQSALYLVCSRFECFPYSIAEAMVLGMPVVASDSFGNAELVDHEKTGLIVPVADVAATAVAITRMMENADERRAFGKAAISRAASMLAPAEIAEATLRVYREAIARREGDDVTAM